MSDWNGIPEDWGKGHYRDVPISKWVAKARARWVATLRRIQDDPDCPYYYDDKSADHFLDFCKQRVKLTRGKRFAGKPFIPEAWQEWDIFRPLFGLKHKADKTRVFRRLLLMVARKNTKTVMAAVIALYMASADAEPGAQVFCIATKESQAEATFGEAKRIVLKDPTLRQHIKVYVNKLICPVLDSKIVKLGRDSSTEDSHDPNCAIVDEYHAHPNNLMLGQMEDAMGARDEPLIAITSTAGNDDLSPCRAEQEYAESILDGDIVNDSYLAYICTPDDPGKWEEEAEWHKANPMLGISVKLEDFRQAFETAKNMPSKKPQFLIKRLNLWTSAANAWVPIEDWDKCGGRVVWPLYDGQPCIAALDVGRTQDLVALSLVFADLEIPGLLNIQMHYWMPGEQDLQQREREDSARYREWIELGFIKQTPGPRIDDDMIFEDASAIFEKYQVVRLSADIWGAVALLQRFEKLGLKIEKHPQTCMAFRAPIDEYEKRIYAKQICHDENPVLRWNIKHCVTYTDGNSNRKFMKDKSRHRIDGAVASAMAIGLFAAMPESKTRPYKKRGIRFL